MRFRRDLNLVEPTERRDMDVASGLISQGWRDVGKEVRDDARECANGYMPITSANCS